MTAIKSAARASRTAATVKGDAAPKAKRAPKSDAPTVTIPAHVQAGYAAGMGLEYAASVYRDAIVSARKDKDPETAIKAINDAYTLGFAAMLYQKKSFAAAPAGAELVCPVNAYLLALDAAGQTLAKRKETGWYEIIRQASTRLWMLRGAARLDKDGNDVAPKEPKAKGPRGPVDPDKSNTLAEGAVDALRSETGASDNHQSNGAGPRKDASNASDATREELDMFLKAHKPTDFTTAERLALSLGKSFGFWVKGAPAMFEGGARQMAMGAALLAFSKAMRELPEAEQPEEEKPARAPRKPRGK